MKRLKDTFLTAVQSRALAELRERLYIKFDVESIILYGSVARGESDEESDIDLLIVTTTPMDRSERHKITDVIFEVNLCYGTNFSSLVVDRKCWEEGALSILPLRDEILKDGLLV
ncbi:MAG: nucleotidyltransferase domain-containing protein [Candidatus Entotheonellia bacterium]